MALDLVVLALGGGLLFYGGDWLVEGIERLAGRLRIPTVIVALVVMGFGTSAPELFVAVNAMVVPSPDVAMGNVVGSNIANLLLVLAITALVAPLAIDRDVLRIDGSAMLAGALAVGAVAMDGVVSRVEAALLICGMLGYLALRWRSLTESEDADGDANERGSRAISLCLVALIALPLGAHFFVGGAIGLARHIGVSEALIGLTVVALGTSLPEMASCIAAAMRRRSEMILGGILGSNVFNGTIVLGGAAVVAPIVAAESFVVFWIPAMLFASLASLIFLRTGFTLTRREASLMIVCYTAIFMI